MLMIRTLFLLTKLLRGPQSSQWLISAVQSFPTPRLLTARRISCLRYLLHMIVTVCFTPLPTPAVCPCAELLSLPGILFSCEHREHRYAPPCTFIDCVGLCQSYSVIFSVASGTSFPQQGWDLSFLLSALAQRKKENRA